MYRLTEKFLSYNLKLYFTFDSIQISPRIDRWVLKKTSLGHVLPAGHFLFEMRYTPERIYTILKEKI